MARFNIDRDFCAKFNEIRNEFAGVKLSKDDVLKAFADLKIKANHITFFVKHGVFTLDRSDKKYTYILPTTPVYIEKLRIIYKDMSDIKKQYNNVANKQKVESVDDIEAAIELLKSHGYKVYKPTTSYEEV